MVDDSGRLAVRALQDAHHSFGIVLPEHLQRLAVDHRGIVAAISSDDCQEVIGNCGINFREAGIGRAIH